MAEICTNSSCFAAASLGTAASVFSSSIQLFAASQCLIPESWPGVTTPIKDSGFDFIVVGSGSAGSTLAYRLSEVKEWKILLIEAGSNPPVESTIPFFAPTLHFTKYDWNRTTEVDNITSRALVGQRVLVTTGKVLGGSSSINVMVYMRGNPGDYEDWAQRGNNGWDWNTTLKYFKKFENMTDRQLLQNPEYAKLHSTMGPVKISRPEIDDKRANKHLQALTELGFEIFPENNGPSQFGIARPHYTIFEGVRQSTAEAYLKRAEDRSNLFILKEAFVTNLVFDKNNKTKVVGVNVKLNSGTSVSYLANKEVISSAGCFGSAKLLLLSGIGPAADLKKLGIEVKADLPVGENFQDHVQGGFILTGSNKTKTPLEGAFEVMKYIYNRTGALASVGVPITTGFYNAYNKSSIVPEFQYGTFYLEANSPKTRIFCDTFIEGDDDACGSMVEINRNSEIIYVVVVLLHPKSRGTVRLQSSNPEDKLSITTGYFKNKEDLEALLAGQYKLMPLVKTKYFESIGAKIKQLKVKKCDDKYKFDSKEYWRCTTVELAFSALHPVGTCAMGYVVNNDLTVKQLSGLRVADASIMPTITSGNTNAPSMMIGERAADFIKEHYGVCSM